MRLSIDLSDEMHRDLKAKAASQGVTISEVVRQAVEKYLKGNFTLGFPSTSPPPSTVAMPTADPALIGTEYRGPISKADQARGRSRK